MAPYVCSICSGSVFLAQAGLLDGTQATPHWAVAPLFREHCPDVQLRPELILCPAGAEHRVITAVALAVGHADPVFFRRIFRRQVGITPARYRQRFAATSTIGPAAN